jgi:SAM-dependent methyltransferase
MQETGVSAAARPQPADAGATERSESGSASLEFGRYYYEHDCGIPYERSPEWLGYFDKVADHIVSRLAAKRVLDAGCALGLLVEKLQERGVDAWGVDISEYAIGQVHESVREHCEVGSLVDPLPVGFPQHFDLVICIEVVEHMAPADAETAIARLASMGDRVLFSSSPIDYAEVTHVNVQPPEHWSTLFARHGLFRNVDFTSGFPTPWTTLYERASADLGEVVRRYDRKTVRLAEELREVRETALRLQGLLTRLEESAAGAAAVERDAALARVGELEDELAESRRLLGTRSGRLLRAYHAARNAMRHRT